MTKKEDDSKNGIVFLATNFLHPRKQLKRRQKRQKPKTETTNLTKDNNQNTIFPTIDVPGVL